MFVARRLHHGEPPNNTQNPPYGTDQCIPQYHGMSGKTTCCGENMRTPSAAPSVFFGSPGPSTRRLCRDRRSTRRSMGCSVTAAPWRPPSVARPSTERPWTWVDGSKRCPFGSYMESQVWNFLGEGPGFELSLLRTCARSKVDFDKGLTEKTEIVESKRFCNTSDVLFGV